MLLYCIDSIFAKWGVYHDPGGARRIEPQRVIGEEILAKVFCENGRRHG